MAEGDDHGAGPGGVPVGESDDLEATTPDLRDGVVALRPPTWSDVDTIAAACQDPEIQR